MKRDYFSYDYDKYNSNFDSSKLGRRIRQCRKDKRLSQDRLVKEMGFMSVRELSDIENGKRMIKIDKLVSLSEFFNLSLDELVKGEKSYNSSIVISFDIGGNNYKSIIEYEEIKNDTALKIIEKYFLEIIKIIKNK